MPQLKKILTIQNLITYIDPSSTWFFFSMVWFLLSATPFYWSVSLTVKCLSMPSSWHSCKKGSLVYSTPLSEYSTLIFFPVCIFICFFHSTKKKTRTFLLSYSVHPITPREIINEWHKVIHTSKCSRLSRPTNVPVNIIKNPLNMVNSSAKLHLDLLANDAVFTGLGTCNGLCFQYPELI